MDQHLKSFYKLDEGNLDKQIYYAQIKYGFGELDEAKILLRTILKE